MADCDCSQISQGNFHKAWLRARHCISLAELLGMSKPLPVATQNDVTGTQDTRWTTQRFRLWEFMCSAERLSGMIINRPPISRRLKDPFTQPLIVDGIVQTWIYLKRLTDITAKFHTLEDPGSSLGASAQAYASALGLDRELRLLASETPKSWWVQDNERFKAENLCQMLHQYFVMRVHLPFTMRQDPGHGHVYSRMSCIEACHTLTQRYQALRRILPSGVFLSPIMDLQALTATVVLLLTAYSGSNNDLLEDQASKVRVEQVTAQVLKVMEEKSGDAGGTNFARQGAATIRSLSKLLQQSEQTDDPRQLSLKVPLLGSINIRRNTSNSQPPIAPGTALATYQPAPALPDPWTDQRQISQPFESATLMQGIQPVTTMQEQNGWQWNPLSWSIEDSQDNLIQDGFMTDNWDGFGAFQGDYSNLHFSG